MFSNLPYDIINYNVFSFLNSKNIIVMKTASKKFKEIKIPFLSLNRELSLKYYNDKNFKNKIHTLIENPLKNLGLDFSYTDITDASMLGNVHTLNLSGTQIRDVSMLGNVHTLNLSSTQVKDVSMLGKVHTLNLSHTYLENVSMLGNVHTLSLCFTEQTYKGNYYREVIEVSNLTNVHTLDLRFSKVKDISMLGNVHTLIFSLSKIIKILKLPKVRILILHDDELLSFEGDRDLLYRKVIERSDLSHVRSLILSGTQVKHKSMLGKVNDILLRFR